MRGGFITVRFFCSRVFWRLLVNVETGRGKEERAVMKSTVAARVIVRSHRQVTDSSIVSEYNAIIIYLRAKITAWLTANAFLAHSARAWGIRGILISSRRPVYVDTNTYVDANIYVYANYNTRSRPLGRSESLFQLYRSLLTNLRGFARESLSPSQRTLQVPSALRAFKCRTKNSSKVTVDKGRERER